MSNQVCDTLLGRHQRWEIDCEKRLGAIFVPTINHQFNENCSSLKEVMESSAEYSAEETGHPEIQESQFNF